MRYRLHTPWSGDHKGTYDFSDPPRVGDTLNVLQADQKTVSSFKVNEVQRHFITDPLSKILSQEAEGIIVVTDLGQGEASKEHPVLGQFVKE